MISEPVRASGVGARDQVELYIGVIQKAITGGLLEGDRLPDRASVLPLLDTLERVHGVQYMHFPAHRLADG